MKVIEMNKKYITVDTGFYWLHVIELLSDDKIELSTELLETIAPHLIKNNLGDFIKDDGYTKNLFNDDGEIEGYTYLDLSYSDISYNVFMHIENFKILDSIPDTWNINLSIKI